MSATERVTFKNEDALPSLPIPDLNTTLAAYKKSMRACLDDDQFSEFEQVFNKFRSSGEADKVHSKFLEEYCSDSTSRNWLEKPWESIAYLKPRLPIYFINYAGTKFGPRDYVTEGFKSAETHNFDFRKIAKIIYRGGYEVVIIEVLSFKTCFTRCPLGAVLLCSLDSNFFETLFTGASH